MAFRPIQGHLHSGQKRDCHAVASVTHKRLFGGRKKESSFSICFCTFSYFSSPLLFFYYTSILFWGTTYPSGLWIDMQTGEVTELVYLWALGWSGKTKHRRASPPFLLHGPGTCLLQQVFSPSRSVCAHTNFTRMGRLKYREISQSKTWSAYIQLREEKQMSQTIRTRVFARTEKTLNIYCLWPHFD